MEKWKESQRERLGMVMSIKNQLVEKTTYQDLSIAFDVHLLCDVC